MPNPVCDPFASCLDLDGRLLISRTAEGPSLAYDPGEIPFGDLVLGGVSIHPYVNLLYRQTWIPEEACYGPVRSVLGLAPAETMTTEVHMREQVDYSRLVQDAVESATVTTHTQERATSSTHAVDDFGITIELFPWLSVAFGSVFEDFVGAVADVGRTVAGAVGGVVDFVLGGIGAIGGGGGMHESTQGDVDTALDTVEAFERKQTITETSYSRSRLLERSVTRTVSNPYRDRSLELRFIPVFRKFKVVTTLWHFHYGIILKAGNLKFPQTTVAARHGDFIQRRAADPRIASVASAELGLEPDVKPRGVVADHLNANSSFYTRQFLAHLQERGDLGTLRSPVLKLLNQPRKGVPKLTKLARVLEWNKLHVRGNNIEIPMIDLERAVAEMQLHRNILDRVREIVPQTITRLEWLHQHSWARHVHLYMGTVVEPVAGQCVLGNLPAPP